MYLYRIVCVLFQGKLFRCGNSRCHSAVRRHHQWNRGRKGRHTGRQSSDPQDVEPSIPGYDCRNILMWSDAAKERRLPPTNGNVLVSQVHINSSCRVIPNLGNCLTGATESYVFWPIFLNLEARFRWSVTIHTCVCLSFVVCVHAQKGVIGHCMQIIHSHS